MSLILKIWAAGIDFDLPGNGGPDCLKHTSSKFRTVESIIALILFSSSFLLGLKLKTPVQTKSLKWPPKTGIRKLLSFLMVLGYSAEIGYKAYTHQFIFIFNPCHLMCLVHLYLLSNYQSYTSFKIWVYRLHLFYLHGPLMAVIFPVTNTRFLPGEVAAFWLEHALLLIIPVYLATHYDVPSKTTKNFFGWTLIAYSIWGFYHYLILFPLAYLSLGNLNSMLCPAITDPFHGYYYRLHGLWHQALFTVISGLFWWFFCKEEEFVKNPSQLVKKFKAFSNPPKSSDFR